MYTAFEIFCRNGKFNVKGEACRLTFDGKTVAFLFSVVYYFGDLLKSANMAFVRHRILISPSFDCLLSFSHSSQLRNCNQRGDFKVTRRVLISTTGVRSSLVCYNFVQWNS